MLHELLRLTTNYLEIEKKIDEAIYIDASVTIWQEHDGKKVHFKGTFVRRLPHTNVIVLKSVDHSRFQFEQEAKIFLQTAHESMIFKTKIDFASPTTLFISFPKELHLKELRLSPRRKIDVQKEVTVIFTLKGRHEKREATLFDISAGGIGIILNEKTRVDREEHLLIHSIAEIKFEPARELSIKYVRDVPYSAPKLFKAGGQFKTTLPENIVSRF